MNVLKPVPDHGSFIFFGSRDGGPGRGFGQTLDVAMRLINRLPVRRIARSSGVAVGWYIRLGFLEVARVETLPSINFTDGIRILFGNG